MGAGSDHDTHCPDTQRTAVGNPELSGSGNKHRGQEEQSVRGSHCGLQFTVPGEITWGEIAEIIEGEIRRKLPN